MVDLDVVCKWLHVKKFTLKHTLMASYTKGIDYTVTKPLVGRASRGYANTERIMMTPDCFKALCMMSRARNAKQVREYFLAVERTLFTYREEIMAGMDNRIGVLERNQRGVGARAKASDDDAGGVIYVIKASSGLDTVPPSHRDARSQALGAAEARRRAPILCAP